MSIAELETESVGECLSYEQDKLDQILSVNNHALSNKFTLIHSNIRSFDRNYDELSVLLDGISISLDVMIFTETWFGENSVSNVDGYTSFHLTRIEQRGGGVSIYIKNS